MENKFRNLSVLLILVMTLMTMSFVSAATVLYVNDDAAQTHVGGTVRLNVSVNAGSMGSDGSSGNFSCSFYAKSASTDNSTWEILATQSNNTAVATAGLNETNATFISFSLQDSNDYIFNVTCGNNSNAAFAFDTLEGVRIDNTIPSAATTLVPTDNTINTNGTITFGGTVVGANTTNCTLYFTGTNPGFPSYTMTHSGDLCEYSFTGVPEQTYDWYIQGTDGSNTTDSSVATIGVDTASGTRRINSEQQKESLAIARALAIGDGSVVGNIPNSVLVVVLIVGGIVIYLIKKR